MVRLQAQQQAQQHCSSTAAAGAAAASPTCHHLFDQLAHVGQREHVAVLHPGVPGQQAVAQQLGEVLLDVMLCTACLLQQLLQLVLGDGDVVPVGQHVLDEPAGGVGGGGGSVVRCVLCWGTGRVVDRDGAVP